MLAVRDHRIWWVGDRAIVGWKRRDRHSDNALLAVIAGVLDHMQDRTLASDLYLPPLGIQRIRIGSRIGCADTCGLTGGAVGVALAVAVAEAESPA